MKPLKESTDDLEKTVMLYSGLSNPLPCLPKRTKFLFKAYQIYPCQVIKRAIRKDLGFSDQVEFLPGFKCLAGKVHCLKRAFLGDTLFVDYAPIEIGHEVSFSFRNIVVTSSHLIDDFQTIAAKPVVIEDGVWVTTGVTILGGVRIGRNSIIGAGSVVTKDIPPNCFAAGNPCVPIKTIQRDMAQAAHKI